MNKKIQTRTIAFIPDGNRRWGENNKISLSNAYIKGVKKIQEVAIWSKDAGFDDVVYFCFSSDNWKREEVELKSFFSLFLNNDNKKKIDKLIKEFAPRIFIHGEIKQFSNLMQKKLESLEKETIINKGVRIHLLLSYNSHKDILFAVNNLIKKRESITEENLSKNLTTNIFSYPECIIRTGGHKRLSGFLLWEAEYSELYFSNSMWEDFSKSEFDEFIKKLNNSKKNYGE